MEAIKEAATESLPLKEEAEVPPPTEQEAYIVTRTFSIPHGHQLHTFQRGTVIDDPHVIALLRKSFQAGRPPLRKAAKQDFLDGDW